MGAAAAWGAACRPAACGAGSSGRLPASGLPRLTAPPSARALDCGYLTQDMIDDYEPALMFTIPRLAIVW